jgi:hypothetical protein
MELIEYLMSIVPNAVVECAECERELEASQAVRRADQFYCSDNCADKANAILLRPQPKSVKAGCFDI